MRKISNADYDLLKRHLQRVAHAARRATDDPVTCNGARLLSLFARKLARRGDDRTDK